MQRRAFMATLAALAAAGSSCTALALAARCERVLLMCYGTRIDASVLDRLSGAAEGEPLRLVPAPERRFDPASLAVETACGDLLGYLPGTHSRVLGAVVEAGFAVTSKALAMRRHPRPALEVDIWLEG